MSPIGSRHAERLRIGRTVATLRPGIAGNEEAVTRHIPHVERRSYQAGLHVVDLRIDQNPPLLLFIPILRHPMVEVLARFEVVREAAARTGEHLLTARDRDEQRREVSAHTDHAAVRRSAVAQRADLETLRAVEHRVRAAQLLLGASLVRQRYAIRRRQASCISNPCTMLATAAGSNATTSTWSPNRPSAVNGPGIR